MDIMNTSDHFLSVFLKVLETELSYEPSQETYFKKGFRKKKKTVFWALPENIFRNGLSHYM